jgi:protein involved in polysaccharide export with SLBB domain
VCPGCDFAKPGHISAWAKANSALGAAESAHRAEVYGQKSDTLADAIQAAGGVSASAAVRREYDPDADAAAEEADVASW